MGRCTEQDSGSLNQNYSPICSSSLYSVWPPHQATSARKPPICPAALRHCPDRRARERQSSEVSGPVVPHSAKATGWPMLGVGIDPVRPWRTTSRKRAPSGVGDSAPPWMQRAAGWTRAARHTSIHPTSRSDSLPCPRYLPTVPGCGNKAGRSRRRRISRSKCSPTCPGRRRMLRCCGAAVLR